MMGCGNPTRVLRISSCGAMPRSLVTIKKLLNPYWVRRARGIPNTRHNSRDCFQPPDHQTTGGFLFYKKNRSLKMNQKSLMTFAILTLIAPAAFGNTGQGTLEETDVCSVEYLLDATKIDYCKPGLSCIPISTLSSTNLGGVCCDKYSINSTMGSNCSGCSSTWTTVNTRYQTRKQGYSLCGGYEHTETNYRCAAGYYGTPTSTTSGCNACPSNATCSAGSTTFSCNKGYYKNGTICTACPTSGGIAGTTSAAGATSITSCYLPSGASFSDSTGSGTYTGNCYYKN